MDSTDYKHGRAEIRISRILNIIVLLSSFVIFFLLTIEILKDQFNSNSPVYSWTQFAICMIFQIDFFYELYISKNRKRFFFYHVFFFIISIPYVNLIEWFHLEVPTFLRVFLRSLLLIRAGYGFIIMMTWFTKSKLTNLLFTYLAFLFGMAYFGSLTFYALEKATNTGIKGFGDSVWWACMDITTVGCAIEPTTSLGRVLAVILAVLGMSVFPILTAYITNIFQNNSSK